MDNGLNSVSSLNEASELISQAQELCKMGGFCLHKFISNKEEVDLCQV